METKKPVKVLQVAPLGAGGVTSLVLNIAEKINKERVHFDYLTFYDRKEFNEERAIALGGKKFTVPIDHYENSLVRSIFKFFYAIYIVRKSRADVIHINASKPYEVLVGVSAKLAGTRKVFFHSHNSAMDKSSGLTSKIMSLLKKMIPLVSDCNLACSELAAQFMFPDSILKSRKYTVIKNAIDTSKYRYSSAIRQAYRDKLGLNNELVIGHIGRFMPQKNHAFLIDIFEEIHIKRPDSVLILIGEGELFDQVKQQVADKKLQDSVIFYGATNEVPQLLQAFDCFLFPSLYEGLPVVGVEVQASGIPLIMSDTITDEIGFTDLAQYISLENTKEILADAVLDAVKQKKDRTVYADLVKEAGFDIYDIVDVLTMLYES